MYWKKEKEQEVDALRVIIDQVLNDPIVKDQGVLVYQISEKIWMHQQHTKEDEKKDFLQDAHEEVEEILKRTEDRIQGIQRGPNNEVRISNRQYSGPAIRKVMKILRDDLEKQFDPKNYPEDVKGFLQFNPLAHAWIDRENKLIVEIEDLFDKYVNGLNPNWKTSAISLIFVKCEIWINQDCDQAYERMRKRLPFVELKRQELRDLKKRADEVRL